MSTDPNPANPMPPPPEQDIPEAERQAILQETLRSLREAFSAPGDEDDAATTAEVIHTAAEAVPVPDEPELPL